MKQNEDRKQNEKIKQVSDLSSLQMLGQGNTAEIYAYENNRILKLFRNGMPLPPILNEYRMAGIIQCSLDCVPKAYELVSYNERYGIIYEQIKGTDLLKIMLRHPFQLERYARKLAQIHADIHQAEIHVQYSVKEKLIRDIDSSGDLTAEEKSRIKLYMEQLPEGSRICHFDYHPGNIMIRDGEPVVIDWMTACTGDAAADTARTCILLQFGELMYAGPVMKLMMHFVERRIGTVYEKEYRTITGMTQAEIEQWKLPVAAARLSEWLTEHERQELQKYIREKLGIITAA